MRSMARPCAAVSGSGRSRNRASTASILPSRRSVAVANALLLSDEKGLGLRTAVDAFLLPGLLFYALRTCFDAAKGRRALFWAVAALAVSLPWTGLYEFATATDVMPFKGSSLFRTGIVRANGPFATDNSYAIVSALAGVFLVWLPAVTGFALDRAARLVCAQIARALLQPHHIRELGEEQVRRCKRDVRRKKGLDGGAVRLIEEQFQPNACVQHEQTRRGHAR